MGGFSFQEDLYSISCFFIRRRSTASKKDPFGVRLFLFQLEIRLHVRIRVIGQYHCREKNDTLLYRYLSLEPRGSDVLKI